MAVTNPDYTDTQAIYDALLGVSGKYKDEFTSNRDTIYNQILPNAISQWGAQRLLGVLRGDPWKQNYAMNVLRYSLGTGQPVYNRTGDGSEAKLVYVPGFRGGAAGSLGGTRGEDEANNFYGRYDSAGRYLGFRSGLINGNYVY